MPAISPGTAGAAATSGSRTIRAGVIGLGGVSFEHLDRLAAMPGVAIAGVCDLSDVLSSAVAERFGLDGGAFTDHRAMLAETRPDVVHVLTPPQAHERLTLDALEAGAHVFVEKPAAPTFAAYAAMRDAAQEHGRLLCENYNYRFTDVVLEALELLRAGTLGRVIAVEASFGGVMGPYGPYGDRDLPHFAHDLPGGALQNFVTHPVSLALPFMGECTGVSSWHRQLDPRTVGDDELRAFLAGPDATAIVAITANATPPAFSLRVQGSQATVEIDIYNRRLELHAGGSASNELLRAGFGRTGAAARLVGRRLAGRNNPYEGLGTLLERFYVAVRDEGTAPVTVAEMDAVNTVVEQLFDPDRQL